MTQLAVTTRVLGGLNSVVAIESYAPRQRSDQ